MHSGLQGTSNTVLDHTHLIVNANVRRPIIKVRDAEDWLREVVRVAKMKIVVGPKAHYCEAEGNKGITAACCIETSHASLHCWDQIDPMLFRFDLYSCAKFETQDILKCVREKVDPTEMDWMVIDRNDGISVVDVGKYP